MRQHRGELVVEIPKLIQQLAAEIRRRRVFRVVAIYAVVAWAVLQVAETVSEPLGFPVWGLRALIIVAISGFPLTFLLAWIIDVRPDGLIFDLPLWQGDIEHPRPQKKSDIIYASLLAILLIGGTYASVQFLLANTPGSNVVLDETPNSIAVDDRTPNSIAVLAFDNNSTEAQSDYFAAGLADEILNLLARIEGISVASRTSSFQFRGGDEGTKAIASLLNVQHVLEGSASLDLDPVSDELNILVFASLIDGESERVTWSNRYEQRGLDDIFAIQQEIAIEVVGNLEIVISDEAADELKEQPTQLVDAYVLYLEGNGRLRSSLDKPVVEAAIELFKEAVELDPTFSSAYAGMCEANLRLFDIGNETRYFDAAKEACNKASKTGTASSDVSLALGTLYSRGNELLKAEQELRKAIEVDPTNADAYIELGNVLRIQGSLIEAEKYHRAAVDLNRNYWKAHEALARFYNRTGRYDEAIAEYERAAELAPHVASVFAAKGGAYFMLGNEEQALADYDTSLAISETRLGFANMAHLYFYSGEFEAAVGMLERATELEKEDHRLRGSLAEALRFVDGREQEAILNYEIAAELAEKYSAKVLENKIKGVTVPWRTIGKLGVYNVHLGNEEEALRLAEESVQLSGGNELAFYYQGLVFLEIGEIDKALTAFEKTIEKNDSYRQLFSTDPDLQQLRDDDRFLALLPNG